MVCHFYDCVLHVQEREPRPNQRCAATGPGVEEDVSLVVAVAASAYNDDADDAGYSPARTVFGCKPKSFADCLDRALAIWETAHAAMIRLH